MQHLLLLKQRSKVIAVENKRVNEAITFFLRLGYKVVRVNPPPSQDLLRSWEESGTGLATDGCLTKGLCSCKHGHRAWLAIEKDGLDNGETEA